MNITVAMAKNCKEIIEQRKLIDQWARITAGISEGGGELLVAADEIEEHILANYDESWSEIGISRGLAASEAGIARIRYAADLPGQDPSDQIVQLERGLKLLNSGSTWGDKRPSVEESKAYARTLLNEIKRDPL